MTDLSNLIVVSEPGHIAVDATGAELVESYLGTLQSDKSRATMTESFKRLAKVIGGDHCDYRSIPWQTLDFDSLNKIRELLSKAHAPNTANLTFSALRQMLRVGFFQGRVSQQLLLSVQGVKRVVGKRVPRGRAVLREEEERLWTVCEAMPFPKKVMWKAVIVSMLGGGARREEACVLPLGGYRDGALFLLGKGNKERRVPIDKAIRGILEEWIDVRKTIATTHRRMFCSLKTREPVSVWALWNNMKLIWRKVGIKGLSPHDFRRTFASRLLAKGFDLAEVKELLGHEDISTTALYDKRDAEALAKKRESVDILYLPRSDPAPEPTELIDASQFPEELLHEDD